MQQLGMWSEAIQHDLDGQPLLHPKQFTLTKNCPIQRPMCLCYQLSKFYMPETMTTATTYNNNNNNNNTKFSKVL